ncbi:MAG: cobalamin-binding protein [Deltaproteobacteria bacterium]|nr:cobalamin-binding protein [Deltaproteobacteria bacterium]
MSSAGAGEGGAPLGWLGTARLAGEPERIVSLAPNLTEMVFALGQGKRVVGVSRFDDFPPEVKTLPKVGGFVDPSLEGILALKPDLVLCVPSAGNESTMRILAERLGVPVFIMPAYSFNDVFRSLRKLGSLLGAKVQARALEASMRQRIKQVKARVKGQARPRVLVVYGHQPLVVAGPGTFADTMLRMAGGQNALTKSALRYPSLPMETVIRLAPEVIVDASMAGDGADTRKDRASAFWARWQVLPAVREGRVHLFNSALWFRPGPRVVDGLETLEGLLHPSKP